jgi:hypothetical protein
MILGDKTLREALRHHFGRVLLIALIISSIALNFFTIPKLLTISYEHVELKRRYSEIVKQHGLPAAVEPPAHGKGEESTAVATPGDRSAEDYRQSKEFFDRLKAKEGRNP